MVQCEGANILSTKIADRRSRASKPAYSVAIRIALSALAQDAKPDLSGTWRFGEEVRSVSTEIDWINYKEPVFTISPIVGLADIIPTFTFRTDGQDLQLKSGTNEVHRTGYWEGNTLFLDTKWINAGVVKATEHAELRLSTDKKVVAKLTRYTGAIKRPNETVDFRKIADGIKGQSR